MSAATISKQSHQNAFTKTMTEVLIPQWAGPLVMFQAWILQENNTALLSFLTQVNCNACGDLKTSENFNVSRACKLSGLFYGSSAKYQKSRKTKWRVNGDLI